MAVLPFDKLVMEAAALSDAEKRQLRDLLDDWLAAGQTTMSEDEFEQRLAALGILSIPEDGATSSEPAQPRVLVKIDGALLSERIIEERR